MGQSLWHIRLAGLAGPAGTDDLGVEARSGQLSGVLGRPGLVTWYLTLHRP
ncbi:MAG: hypothetical protein JW862_15355 [Anaerolineales bacterium]|nr:hypothetical protein [Anaerolineales bacterium]